MSNMGGTRYFYIYKDKIYRSLANLYRKHRIARCRTNGHKWEDNKCTDCRTIRITVREVLDYVQYMSTNIPALYFSCGEAIVKHDLDLIHELNPIIGTKRRKSGGDG